jgi:hypothetical protein
LFAVATALYNILLADVLGKIAPAFTLAKKPGH